MTDTISNYTFFSFQNAKKTIIDRKVDLSFKSTLRAVFQFIRNETEMS